MYWSNFLGGCQFPIWGASWCFRIHVLSHVLLRKNSLEHILTLKLILVCLKETLKSIIKINHHHKPELTLFIYFSFSLILIFPTNNPTYIFISNDFFSSVNFWISFVSQRMWGYFCCYFQCFLCSLGKILEFSAYDFFEFFFKCNFRNI